MISMIVLTIISAAGIGFFLVCLYGFDRAAKEPLKSGMLILLPSQTAQPLLQPRFGQNKISFERATSNAGAIVLPFPRKPAWALRHIS